MPPAATIEQTWTKEEKSRAENKLKRFLHLSNQFNVYMCGNLELHKSYEVEKLDSVSDFIKAKDLDGLLKILESVNDEGTLTTRKALFFALAFASTLPKDQTEKHKVYASLSKISRNIEDLFAFVKFQSTLRDKKISSGLAKVIENYYTLKDPYKLAKEVVNKTSYHSWSHKDIFKLIHIKSTQFPTITIIVYLMFGLDSAIAVAEGKGEVAQSIIKLFTKVDELKRSESESRIIELIKELQCSSPTRVPSYYHKHASVWEALIPNLPIRDLIGYLPRFHKLEFMKVPSFNHKLLTVLQNENIKIHPVEAHIGLINFRKGGKAKDPKFLNYLKGKKVQVTEADLKKTGNKTSAETSTAAAGTSAASTAAASTSAAASAVGGPKPDPAPVEAKPHFRVPQSIDKALNKIVSQSFVNCKAIGGAKSFFILIDRTEKMLSPCLNLKNYSCMEAAVLLAYWLWRTEKQVVVAATSSSAVKGKSNKVEVILDEKKDKLAVLTYDQALKEFSKSACASRVNEKLLFESAITKKKNYNIFIHLTHNYVVPMKPVKEPGIGFVNTLVEEFKKYKADANNPQSRLIIFSLGSANSALATEDENVLNICGFSKDVPNIVEAFIKGSFV